MIIINPVEFYKFLKNQYEEEYLLIDPDNVFTFGFVANLNEFINNKSNLTQHPADLSGTNSKKDCEHKGPQDG